MRPNIRCNDATTSSQVNYQKIVDYEDVTNLKIDLINSLIQFEQGKFPVGDVKQYKEALEALNLKNSKIKQFYINNQEQLDNTNFNIYYKKESNTLHS